MYLRLSTQLYCIGYVLSLYGICYVSCYIVDVFPILYGHIARYAGMFHKIMYIYNTIMFHVPCTYIIYIFTFIIVIIQALFYGAICCIQARIVLRLMLWVSSLTHHSYNIISNILGTFILYHPERRLTPIMYFSKHFTKSGTSHYFSIRDFEYIIRLTSLSCF